jgi:hypothetical protein
LPSAQRDIPRHHAQQQKHKMREEQGKDGLVMNNRGYPIMKAKGWAGVAAGAVAVKGATRAQKHGLGKCDL